MEKRCVSSREWRESDFSFQWLEIPDFHLYVCLSHGLTRSHTNNAMEPENYPALYKCLKQKINSCRFGTAFLLRDLALLPFDDLLRLDPRPTSLLIDPEMPYYAVHLLVAMLGCLVMVPDAYRGDEAPICKFYSKKQPVDWNADQMLEKVRSDLGISLQAWIKEEPAVNCTAAGVMSYSNFSDGFLAVTKGLMEGLKEGYFARKLGSELPGLTCSARDMLWAQEVFENRELSTFEKCLEMVGTHPRAMEIRASRASLQSDHDGPSEISVMNPHFVSLSSVSQVRPKIDR